VDFVYSPLIHENVVNVDPTVREDTGCGDSFAAAIAAYFLFQIRPYYFGEAVLAPSAPVPPPSQPPSDNPPKAG